MVVSAPAEQPYSVSCIETMSKCLLKREHGGKEVVT